MILGRASLEMTDLVILRWLLVKNINYKAGTPAFFLTNFSGNQIGKYQQPLAQVFVIQV
jgi:hypothetical protein